MFSQRGHLTLAHNDASMRTMRWRAEVNKLPGRRLRGDRPGRDRASWCPYLDTSASTALSDPRRAVPPARRHRSATTPWSGATPAPPTRTGVHIHQQTEVTGIDVERGARHRRARPPAGASRRRCVVNCTAGWSVAHLGHGRRRAAGQTLPLAGRGHRAGQAVPATPSSSPARCTSTSARPTAASSCSARASTPSRRTRCAARWSSARAGRARAGADAVAGEDAAAAPVGRAVRHDARLLADHGPDAGRGLLRRRRLGHLRLQGRPGVRRGDGGAASPTGKPPEIISAFGLDRFLSGRLVGEKGAAAVGH